MIFWIILFPKDIISTPLTIAPNIHSLRINMIGKIVTVKIDRPLGSAHPKHPDLIYPVNYGYVDGVIAPDGEEQDAYVIGVNVPVSSFEGRIIAIIHRKNDIEDKWVVAPQNMIFTKKEIQNLTHFQEKYFDIEIITE